MPRTKKSSIKSVAIYAHNKPEKEKEERTFIRELLRFFYKKNITHITGCTRTQEILNGVLPETNDRKGYDLKIAIGGDGVLLKMIRTLTKEDGYFLGINFGTLGFLSELTPDNALESLEGMLNGDIFIDERMILKVFVYRKVKRRYVKVFSGYALNEITLGHTGISRLTDFHVKANRRFLSTYRSDRVIFSTPTGSTAYSLSAGGPIIAPDMSAICVTPVSPHTLTHRPIVLPSDYIFHITPDTRADELSLTIDGQLHTSVGHSDRLMIQRATRTAKFIRAKKYNYFRSLRNKLNWGHR